MKKEGKKSAEQAEDKMSVPQQSAPSVNIGKSTFPKVYRTEPIYMSGWDQGSQQLIDASPSPTGAKLGETFLGQVSEGWQ